MITKKKLGRTQGMSTPLQTTSRNFIPRLLEFVERYACLGLAADLLHLTPAELFGLYLFLLKLEGAV